MIRRPTLDMSGCGVIEQGPLLAQFFISPEIFCEILSPGINSNQNKMEPSLPNLKRKTARICSIVYSLLFGLQLEVGAWRVTVQLYRSFTRKMMSTIQRTMTSEPFLILRTFANLILQSASTCFQSAIS